MAGQQFSPEYWQEFRTHYRALIGSAIGFAFGIGLNTYTIALFGPKMLEEFRWSEHEYALLSSLVIVSIFVFPVVGRFTDRLGVRPAFVLGALSMPLSYISFTLMSGDIKVFFALFICQLIVGGFSTTAVCTRPIAERFDKARGMALAVMTCAPPLVGAIAVWPLEALIDAQGWRSAYWVLAGVSLVAGLLAAVITPPSPPETLAKADRTAAKNKADYAQIVKSPAFWLIIGGMFFINLPQSLLGPQLKLMLTGVGATPGQATAMVSLFASSVVLGRIICGLTLDRLMPHKIAAVMFGLPALGLLVLASPYDMPILITLAVVTMGLAQGSEGDVLPFLAAKRFDVRVFSLVMGFVGTATVLGTSVGAVMLKIILEHMHSYTPYLLICAALTVVGAFLFLMLGRKTVSEENTTF